MLIALIALAMIFIYTVGATAFIRLTGIGIYKRGGTENKIALTFDDGPDPFYTPLLLELLERHRVKATFFVVGTKARAHPAIIQDIHKRGHVIGIHNDQHISNWLLPPLLFKKQLRKAQAAILEITGVAPLYYRPPWGHFNLFTLIASRRLHIIMWTAIPGDWKEDVDPSRLAHLLKQARSKGAVITLHDSGTTFGADKHAPKNTLQALELFLSDKSSSNYSFVTVHDLFSEAIRSGE
ncbi:polysaccharide deacetylase family protein [Bacillus thermotolerans]|uniref:polysaccharide deacetylase family protein n=1 Tax=Bacillus thermotolerans TaxID=1221996 RepID=UPI0005892CFC|nr:polysaccharide deacetylase family protein [Bacillus thermotolerans]KKB44211.1 Polysaccharide deacetylase [Bacillus thermotolerans]